MCILQENVTEVTHSQLHYYDANDVIEKYMCQCLPFEDWTKSVHQNKDRGSDRFHL